MSGLDDAAKMEKLSMASDSVSDMDQAESKIRGQDMQWGLLPTMAGLACRAGSAINGFQSFPTFPAWLGKYSHGSKLKRMTQELVHHTSLSIGQGFCPIRLDYVPYLKTHLLDMLKKEGSDGAEGVVKILDAYGLSKDDFTETLKELQLTIDKDKVLRDRFDDLDSKMKTALTKLYNALEHRSQALVSGQVFIT
jgi:hypothetical protein